MRRDAAWIKKARAQSPSVELLHLDDSIPFIVNLITGIICLTGGSILWYLIYQTGQ